MENRIKMNTQSLQDKFPDIYREFFSNCPLVASASGCFWIAGEYGLLYGGMAILQKLPVRVYIGIHPTSKSEVTHGGGWAFTPSKQRFEYHELSFEDNEKLLNFLKEEMKKIYGENFPGFRIKYILETPLSSGFNSSGATAAALSSAFLLLTDQLTINDIKSWENRKTSENIQDQKFNKTFRMACKIRSIFYKGLTSGSGVFPAFIKGYYPIIYFTEKRLGFEKPENNTRFPVRNEENLDIYDQLNYKAFKMDEFEKISGEWPIDFGIIYSGDFIRPSIAIKSISNLQKVLNDVRELLVKKFKPYLEGMPDTLISDIIKNPYDLWLSYIKSINAITAEIFWELYDIFKNGISRTNVVDLTKSINAHQDALRLIDISSNKLDMVCNTIIEETLKIDDIVGCKITGAGKKGGVLFITPFHGLRDTIFEIIKKIKQKTEENIWLDYASWIDGVGGEGIKIEQDLRNGIYSDFISPGAIQVKHLTKEGIIHPDIYTYEEFEVKKQRMDLLLDAVEGDIYILGKKLTSKDIHSCSETVNILKILIENIGKFIPNETLPRSSYSQDRGELQSKIVSPICRAVEKYLRKKLPLSLSGGLGDFAIKLDKGLNIYILEKVF